MKKIFLKLVVIFILFLNLFFVFSNLSNAFVSGRDAYELNGNEKILSRTQKTTGGIVKTVQLIGSGLAVLMLAYVAIKYMMSAPGERAEYKKTLTTYIVGAIIMFGSSNLLVVIYNFAQNNVIN